MDFAIKHNFPLDLIIFNFDNATVDRPNPKIFDLALLAITRFGVGLSDVLRFKDIAKIVHAAVQIEGSDLGDASERLRGDKAIVKAAIKQNPTAFCYASDKLQRDTSFLLELCQTNGKVIQSIPVDRITPDMVFAALKQNPDALKGASKELLKMVREWGA